MPTAVEETAAQLQLRVVCPVVATAKDEGLFDASFATLLLRIRALHQSAATPYIRQLHNNIMDETTTKPNERDAALGQILVMQGAYLSAPFPKDTRASEFGNPNLPCLLRPIPHEEATAREKLRVICPVVASIKELGLCAETTFAVLLMRSLQLISSQHHSRVFNLNRRVMDESIADNQRDQALGELLVTHGGYFSRNLVPAATKNAIYCRWKGLCELNCTARPADMQIPLLLSRGGVTYHSNFEEQRNVRLDARRERVAELLGLQVLPSSSP